MGSPHGVHIGVVMKPAFVLSGFLAIALVAPSLVLAAPLVLSCESDTNNESKQFLIDYEGKSVQQIAVQPERNPPGQAEISDTSIKWKTIMKVSDAAGGIHDWNVEGSINRLAGSIYWRATNPGNYMQELKFSGKCRQATQKF
jgi:hypothetical protein